MEFQRLIRDEIVNHMRNKTSYFLNRNMDSFGQIMHNSTVGVFEDSTTVLEQGDDVDVIYLDFCKAFDKVPHKRLLKKLWGYGIRGNVHA